MGEDTIRQRIKYLVEHGDLYNQDRPLGENRGVRLLWALVILTVVQIAIAVVSIVMPH